MKASATSGVCSAGLRTTPLPPIRAGADLVGDQVERVVEGRDRARPRRPARGCTSRGGSRRGGCHRRGGSGPRAGRPARRRGARSRPRAAPRARRRGWSCSPRGRSARRSRPGAPCSSAAARCRASRRCQTGQAGPTSTACATARTASSTSAGGAVADDADEPPVLGVAHVQGGVRAVASGLPRRRRRRGSRGTCWLSWSNCDRGSAYRQLQVVDNIHGAWCAGDL